MKLIKPRYLVAFGFILLAISGYQLSHATLHITSQYFQLAFVFIGLSSGFFFVPTMHTAYSTLAPKYNDEASGLFNFSRAMAGTLGVSITSTIITMQTQVNWNGLVHNISLYNKHFNNWLASEGLPLKDPHTIALLSHKLAALSGLYAYRDAFYFGMILSMVVLPLTLFLKNRTVKVKP